MNKETLTLTYKQLMLNQNFWSKITQSPCPNDTSAYWLGRLWQKVESAQKEVGKVFLPFLKTMEEKFGVKDEKGNYRVMTNGLPMPRTECRDEYEAEFETFMSKTIDIEFTKLALDKFSHIQKTPLDMDILTAIADVTEESVAAKKPSLPDMASIANLR